jgi:imidazolonepropionase-like amidohydrolase
MYPAKTALFLILVQTGITGCAHTGALPFDPPAIEADFIFENVSIVPMSDEVILADKAVAVRDGEILAILDQSDVARVHASHRINGQGNYLMPGLADMHVHLRMEPQSFFNLQLANGVTTVHNMRDGDGGIDHIALQAAVASGQIDGPRYLISGPQLDGETLSTVSDVAAVLDRHAEHGFDTIKVHGDLAPGVYHALIEAARARGFRVTGHAQHLMPLAQTLRMDAIEHIEELLYVSPDPAFGRAAAGSMDNFLKAYYAHATRLTDSGYRATIVDEVAASNVYINPTLIIYSMIPVYLSDDEFKALHDDDRLAYLPEKIRKTSLNWKENDYRANLAPVFRKLLNEVGADATPAEHFEKNIILLGRLMVELHEAGVPLLLGSDAFGALVPGFALHQELALMVATGLTPYDALRTGTVNVAAYLGEADQAGTVETGKRADFILVAGDPLKNIRNAAAVRGVFAQGKWHSATDLEAMLAQVRAADRQPEERVSPAVR